MYVLGGRKGISLTCLCGDAFLLRYIICNSINNLQCIHSGGRPAPACGKPTLTRAKFCMQIVCALELITRHSSVLFIVCNLLLQNSLSFHLRRLHKSKNGCAGSRILVQVVENIPKLFNIYESWILAITFTLISRYITLIKNRLLWFVELSVLLEA